MSRFKKYDNPNKEILDLIKVGNIIRINERVQPYLVTGVSENFIVAIYLRDKGKEFYTYTVINKNPAKWDWNKVEKDKPYCGPDNSNGCYFGDTDKFEGNYYALEDEKWLKGYLNAFEEGLANKQKASPLEVSVRHGLAIRRIRIKDGE